MNAYVTFKDEQSTDEALKLNGTEVDGLHIRVDKTEEEKQHDQKRSVFIGNLAYRLEEESLRRHFVDCGDVENIRIIRDPKTGMGKGFGYITFQDASSVDLALLLNGEPLEGRDLRVHRSTSKPQNNGSMSAKTKEKSDKNSSAPGGFSGKKPVKFHKSSSANDGQSKKDRTISSTKNRRDANESSSLTSTPTDRKYKGNTSNLDAKVRKQKKKKEIRKKLRESKMRKRGRMLLGIQQTA